MGDKLTIKVVAANLTKRQLDYEWVREEAPGAKPAKTVKDAKPVKKSARKAKGDK